MTTHKIAVLPGDGIGQEVTPEARKVLQVVAKATGARLRVRGRRWSAGRPSTPPARRCRTPRSRSASRATPSSSGRWAGPSGTACRRSSGRSAGCSRIRKELDLFANLRPAQCFPMLVDASPLKRSVVEGTDLMVIRELTGGLYFGEPRGREAFADGGERAVNTMVYTSREIERVARAAFDVAMKRKKRLASVDKANVLVVSQLWREVVTRVAKDYPQVDARARAGGQLRDGARAQADAVRHPRDREHLRRHPVRRGGHPGRVDGHAAVGQPGRHGGRSTSPSTAPRRTSRGRAWPTRSRPSCPPPCCCGTRSTAAPTRTGSRRRCCACSSRATGPRDIHAAGNTLGGHERDGRPDRCAKSSSRTSDRRQEMARRWWWRWSA